MAFCFFQGKIVPISKASLSPYDIGILRGFAFFEALRTYQRQPFHLKDHLARLKNAGKHFNVKIPLSDSGVARAIDSLIAKNIPKNKEANIRIMFTGGEAIRMIEPNPAGPTFYILVEEFRPFPENSYQQGCSLIVEEFQRQLPEYKTTNYIEAVSLQEKMKRAGALEILYVSDGHVRECSTSNIFIVKNGNLITPEKGILHGITRKVVLQEARRARIPVKVRDVSERELYGADEVFITSSFKEVMPVVAVDKRRVGDGTVGSLTTHIRQLFHTATKQPDSN